MGPVKAHNSQQRKSEVYKIARTELNQKYRVKAMPQITYQFLDEKLTLNTKTGPIVKTHPHQSAITNWKPTEKMKRRESQESSGSAILVRNQDSFRRMLHHLKSQEWITVDLELHTYYSYFGMTCTIQISTWKHDFIVDPFKLRAEIRSELKSVFEDDDILKVLHASPNDLRILQIEWNIFINPLIDTQLIYEQLYPGNRGISFKNIVEATRVLPPGHILDKKFQAADWRLRPLPEEYLEYAKGDTRYLYRVWEELKREVFSPSNPKSVVESILKPSKTLSEKIFSYPRYDVEDEIKKLKDKPFVKDKRLFENIHIFRDQLAQKNDVNPAAIMHREILHEIVIKFPTTMTQLQNILTDTRRLTHRDCEYILKLVRDYKDPIPVENIDSDEDWEGPQPNLTVRVTVPSPEPEIEHDVLEISAPNDNFTPIICNRCERQGHTAKECWEPNTKQAKKKYLQLHPDKKKAYNKHRMLKRKLKKFKK
jgi:ribonuclease D